MTVLFFSSSATIGQIAFDMCRGLRPEKNWRFMALETKSQQTEFEANVRNTGNYPELIISYLNPYILPEWLIAGCEGKAFNIHPATPEFPGRDPDHFAFYEGSESAGATLHRMTAKVDSGEILDVAKEPFTRSQGISRFSALSSNLSLTVLMRNIDSLIDGDITARGTWLWRPSAKRSRADFLAMCKLDKDMPAGEMKRRVDAFFNPNYRSLHLEINGFRFVYDPSNNSNSPPGSLGIISEGWPNITKGKEHLMVSNSSNKKGIYLRSIRDTDSPYYFQWINNRELVNFNSPFKPVSEAEHNEWFESVSTKDDMKIFTIVEQSSEMVIGSCSLRNINDHCRNAELQIRIGDAKYRDKNYGTAAVLELLNFGFQDLNLRRIYLDVFETNERAIRVYEKCGLSREGIKRDAVFIDGEYINVVIMSILEDEFLKNSALG